MSTKIYDAYVMKDVPTLYELRKRVSRLRSVVQEEFFNLYTKKVAVLACSIIDDLSLNKSVYSEEYPNSIWSEAHKQVEDRNRHIQKTKERNPSYDFHCELEIIPIKNKIMVMVFCEQPRIIEIIARQKYLKYYGYWNNTDPDERCSEKEWNQRKKDWNEALPGIGIPSENGFNVQLHAPYFLLPEDFIERLLRIAPSYEDRIENKAFKMAWNKMTEIEIKKMKTNDINENLRLCTKALQLVRSTPQGQRILKQCRKKVSNSISPIITEEMLKVELYPRKNKGNKKRQ